jgi:hypothetical protein
LNKIVQYSKTKVVISNLTTFLKDLVESLNTLLDPSKNIKLNLSPREIYGETLQSIRTITIGCQKFCPLCRRQCDLKHTSSEEEHSCESH